MAYTLEPERLYEHALVALATIPEIGQRVIGDAAEFQKKVAGEIREIDPVVVVILDTGERRQYNYPTWKIQVMKGHYYLEQFRPPLPDFTDDQMAALLTILERHERVHPVLRFHSISRPDDVLRFCPHCEQQLTGGTSHEWDEAGHKPDCVGPIIHQTKIDVSIWRMRRRGEALPGRQFGFKDLEGNK